MPSFLRYLFGFLIAAFIVGAPIGYACYCQSQVRNFHVVEDGILYRSGQMSLSKLQATIHDYGIKTVVTLRDSWDPKDPPPDLAEEKYCKQEDIAYHRISPRNWWSPDGSVPAERGVRKFRDIMDNRDNYPVLIHCFAGVHRTGAFCAVYRMEYQHWTNKQALLELRASGYSNLDDEWDLLGYLEEYQPRWKQQGKSEPTMARTRTEHKIVKHTKRKARKVIN